MTSGRPGRSPRSERDYFLERRYPAFGNLVPRDVASRAAKERCDAGHGVGPTGLGVYLDFSESIGRLGKRVIEERYGNLFQMYEKITGENPYEAPMRIFPALHYTMGGLWVDYNLMSTIPGLYVLGEANFSDHGANRLGASALMQGLADGYFVIPYTIGDYFGNTKLDKLDASHPEFKKVEQEVSDRTKRLLGLQRQAHRRLAPPRAGAPLLGEVRDGPQRDGAQEGAGRDPGHPRGVLEERHGAGHRRGDLNQALERAGRVADFLEFAELMVAGRARAPRVVRRPLPRGEPDGGRRGQARRRELQPRGRLGVPGRGEGAGPAQGAAHLRIRQAVAKELQVNLTLKVWRQKSHQGNGPKDKGRMVTYDAPDISPDMSFLEMLDIVNAKLELAGEEPIAFDHDCREGICGTCSLMINGIAHGPDAGTTACQLHMRRFKDGDTIYIEPWRARAFPILKDLIVDRGAFDRIMQAGGFISVNTGGTPDANASRSPRRRRSCRWTPPPASAAAPAWRAARTPAPCSSSRPRSPSSPTSPRDSPSATSACRR